MTIHRAGRSDGGPSFSGHNPGRQETRRAGKAKDSTILSGETVTSSAYLLESDTEVLHLLNSEAYRQRHYATNTPGPP
jgi:hypothetical protein